jgi:hypothetical protein
VLFSITKMVHTDPYLASISVPSAPDRRVAIKYSPSYKPGPVDAAQILIGKSVAEASNIYESSGAPAAVLELKAIRRRLHEPEQFRNKSALCPSTGC